MLASSSKVFSDFGTSDLYFAIFKAFRENGIEIPFPQRDLHLKSVEAPLPWSADPAELGVLAA